MREVIRQPISRNQWQSGRRGVPDEGGNQTPSDAIRETQSDAIRGAIRGASRDAIRDAIRRTIVGKGERASTKRRDQKESFSPQLMIPIAHIGRSIGKRAPLIAIGKQAPRLGNTLVCATVATAIATAVACAVATAVAAPIKQLSTGMPPANDREAERIPGRNRANERHPLRRLCLIRRLLGRSPLSSRMHLAHPR